MAGTVERTIQQLATSLPDATRGVACEGTSLEATTFNAGAKAFVFLRRTEGGYEVRLKLDASIAEAKELAAAEPKRYAIGANGWAKLGFDDTNAPLELLRRWIPESHAALTKAKPNAKAKSKAKAKPKKGAAR